MFYGNNLTKFYYFHNVLWVKLIASYYNGKRTHAIVMNLTSANTVFLL